MLKAAALRGWLDEKRAALEALTSILRAGADLTITYYAKDAARWIHDTERSELFAPSEDCRTTSPSLGVTAAVYPLGPGDRDRVSGLL